MSKINEEITTALEQAFENGLTERTMECFKKEAQKLADGIIDDLEWRIRDELVMHVVSQIEKMAERAVEAMLAGNENEMRRWLSCDKRAADHQYIGWTGRTDGSYQRRVDEAHPVIHGRLFEQGALLLRKQVAQANEALLRDERIRDLEDQVKSLVAQVNAKERDLEQLRDRLRAA